MTSEKGTSQMQSLQLYIHESNGPIKLIVDEAICL